MADFLFLQNERKGASLNMKAKDGDLYCVDRQDKRGG